MLARLTNFELNREIAVKSIAAPSHGYDVTLAFVCFGKPMKMLNPKASSDCFAIFFPSSIFMRWKQMKSYPLTAGLTSHIHVNFVRAISRLYLPIMLKHLVFPPFGYLSSERKKWWVMRRLLSSRTRIKLMSVNRRLNGLPWARSFIQHSTHQANTSSP